MLCGIENEIKLLVVLEATPTCWYLWQYRNVVIGGAIEANFSGL
jgi:hypothetical protein